MKGLHATQTVHNHPRIYGEPYKDTDAAVFGLDTGTVTPTKQSEKDSCDINKIMERYEATGLLPDLIQREPQYGDFSDAATFHEAMDIVAHANAQFSALPASVRERFGNDPAKFLAFIEKAENDDSAKKELIEMGLAEERKPAPETQEDILKAIRENTKPSKTPQTPASGASKAKGDSE